MRSVFTLIVFLACMHPMLYAQEPTNSGVDIDGFDLDSEGDRRLLAFCQGALLQARVLTCSPLAGNTDRWILEGLVPRKEFLTALDSTPSSSLATFEVSRPDRIEKRNIDDILEQY